MLTRMNVQGVNQTRMDVILDTHPSGKKLLLSLTADSKELEFFETV